MIEIITSVNKVLNDFIWGVPAMTCIIVALILIGGVKRIGKISEKLVPLMALLYIVLGLIWGISDAFNGFMTVPNLIAVFLLTPEVLKLIREYFHKEKNVRQTEKKPRLRSGLFCMRLGCKAQASPRGVTSCELKFSTPCAIIPPNCEVLL